MTLTGVGGVGKTRLALRVASDVTGSFPDGVHVAELADLRDPELLATGVLGALDVARPGHPGADATAALVARLGERRVLLVLDNCEHLVDACARLTDTLLRGAPGLRVLATSRQPLGIAGEQVFPVEPLPVPEAGDVAGAGHRLRALSGNPAVALFVERAAAVLPGFAVTESDTAIAVAVAELVRRLDGLPFAIELAAARVRSLTPREILERLTDRFALLTGGSRVAAERQRTLRALIDWSHELCTERERLLWARASVFRSGFDLDGLERVCADAELPAAALLDALVARSIVNCRQENGHSLYHMLETIREYGHERLVASGSLDVLRARHRDHYAEPTARAGQEWFGARQVDWFTRLRLDHPNLRAALEFCLERPGQARAGLALAVSPRHYWLTAGLLSEGRRWLSLLLAADRAHGGPDTDARVRALVTDTYLGILQGAPDAEVRSALAACEEAARLGGHRRESAWVWHHHGILAVWREDFAGAVGLFARACAEFRVRGCLDAALECRVKFAIAHAYGGDVGKAAEACGDAEVPRSTWPMRVPSSPIRMSGAQASPWPSTRRPAGSRSASASGRSRRCRGVEDAVGRSAPTCPQPDT
ncbi:hypothetical protein ACFC34_39010 [Streptomyces sp. NPDC056053]|uniref:ATP-binding protein n=1 Tax=Streptomyces sp. NPDC056053 TaxID=3345696 RepID=UPI0035DB3F4F